MTASNDDEKKSALGEEMRKVEAARKHEEQLKVAREKAEYSAKIQQERSASGIKAKLKEVKEGVHVLNERKEGRHPTSNQSLQVGTFFSWFMDSVPAFEAIVKSIVCKVHAMRKQYIGQPVSSFFVENAMYAYYRVLDAATADELQLPDIKYVNAIDSEGVLNVEMLRESFGDLFNDADGNYSEKIAKNSYQLLEGYVHEWLDSLEPGYFVAQVDGKNMVFPKTNGIFHNNKWILDERLVRDNYEDEDCDVYNGVYCPKIGAQPKVGRTSLFVNAVDYENLVQGAGNPEKSLEVFMRGKCPDLELTQEFSFRP